jgi:hypothetical protein
MQHIRWDRHSFVIIIAGSYRSSLNFINIIKKDILSEFNDHDLPFENVK